MNSVVENRLSTAQIELMASFNEAFMNIREPNVNLDSDICCSKEFVEYFSNIFAVYHTITEHKFEKKSFEFAFKYAAISAGWECDITRSGTHPGEDILFNGVGCSLKTEGGRSASSIDISKFSEGRYIAAYKTEVSERDIKSSGKIKADVNDELKKLYEKRERDLKPKLVDEFKVHFKRHIDNYNRIFLLKSQPINGEGGVITAYRYRLIEIPKELLERALTLTVDDFEVLRGSGATSAKVMVNKSRAFTVTLDGSVEKVSLKGISIDQCFVHADFHVDINL